LDFDEKFRIFVFVGTVIAIYYDVFVAKMFSQLPIFGVATAAFHGREPQCARTVMLLI
jgi:hypothetical protein